MITVTGPTIARIVMALAGAVLIALGVFSAITNRVTGHEALGGLAALLAGTMAGLWLRRQKRDGGTS